MKRSSAATIDPASQSKLSGVKEVRFTGVATLPASSGIYEIWAGPLPLKVGIAVNLRERLMAHATS